MSSFHKINIGHDTKKQINLKKQIFMSLMLNDTIFLKTLQLFAQTNQTSRRRGGLVIAKNLCTRSSQCTAVRSVHGPHYLIMTAVQPRGRARQAWLGNPTKNTGQYRVYKY